MKRLVRLDKLLPGDIVLTVDKRSLVSRSVKGATGSPYSHASIIVSRFIRLESIREGVRLTSIPAVVGRAEAGEESLFWDTRQFARVAVLRHRTVTSNIGQRIETALVSELGTPYASHVQLAASLRSRGERWTFHAKALERPGLRKLLPPSDVPGVFCSELVARVLQEANLKPFDVPREATSVLPKDFLAPDSNFTELSDAYHNRGRRSRLRKTDTLNTLHREQARVFEQLGSAGPTDARLRDLREWVRQIEERPLRDTPMTSAETAVDKCLRQWHDLVRDVLRKCREVETVLEESQTARIELPSEAWLKNQISTTYQPIVEHLDSLGFDYRTLMR